MIVLVVVVILMRGSSEQYAARMAPSEQYQVESRMVDEARPAASAPASAGGLGVSTAEAITLPTAQDLATAQSADTLRLLIRTGQMVIQVDSLEPAVAEVRRIAAAAGGYVASSSLRTTDRVRSASVEIKLPAPRFDQGFERLRSVGKVEVADVSAQDVGEEYVDVAARMANARRLESRLLDLLANRAGRLQEVLEVERELARVRGEIERYAGRLQFLRQHAAVSTITVELHEPGTVIGERPGAGAIGEAFLQAWRNLIWLVAFLIQALGVVLPLGLLGWGGWALWRRYGRTSG